VRLLLRSTHGLTPTDAGRDFYQPAKRSIEDVEEAEAAARGAAVTWSGRLRVNAPLTFARLHVIPRLPIFMTEHPSLDVDVVLDDRDIDLIEAGIDVALRLGRLGDSGTTVRKIGHCRSCVVGTPSYFAAPGRPKTPGDLIEHQAVIYEQRVGGPTWTFRQGTAETTVTVRGRLRVSAAEEVREGVLAGLGLSIGGSEWLFTPELKSGEIISVLQEWSLPAVDLWALFPAGRQASAKARAFTSFIERQLAGGEVL
jgi:DNA-binding transcriptional LysR family regulator